MTQFKTSIITAKGHALMAKLLNNQGTAKFTKVVTSDTVYKDEQLEALTAISAIKQSVAVSNVTVTNSSTVTVEAAIENSKLTQGYYLNTIGLYAQDPTAGEILYSVTTAEQNAFIPAFNSVTSTGLIVKLITSVSNSENVSLEINPAATMTREDTLTLISEIMPVTKVAGFAPDESGNVAISSGSRNYALGTLDSSFIMHGNDSSTITREDGDYGEKVFHIKTTESGRNASIWLSPDQLSNANLNSRSGDSCSFSVEAKGTGTFSIAWENNKSSVSNALSEEYKRVGVASRPAETLPNIQLTITDEVWIRFAHLGHGSIIDDWSPAYEETVRTVGGQKPDQKTGDIDTSGYAKQSKDNIFTANNDFSIVPTIISRPIATINDFEFLGQNMILDSANMTLTDVWIQSKTVSTVSGSEPGISASTTKTPWDSKGAIVDLVAGSEYTFSQYVSYTGTGTEGMKLLIRTGTDPNSGTSLVNHNYDNLTSNLERYSYTFVANVTGKHVITSSSLNASAGLITSERWQLEPGHVLTPYKPAVSDFNSLNAKILALETQVNKLGGTTNE